MLFQIMLSIYAFRIQRSSKCFLKAPKKKINKVYLSQQTSK